MEAKAEFLRELTAKLVVLREWEKLDPRMMESVVLGKSKNQKNFLKLNFQIDKQNLLEYE